MSKTPRQREAEADAEREFQHYATGNGSWLADEECEGTRDYLSEAWRILEGGTMLMAQRAHLQALQEYYQQQLREHLEQITTLDDALETMVKEVNDLQTNGRTAQL